MLMFPTINVSLFSHQLLLLCFEALLFVVQNSLIVVSSWGTDPFIIM